MKSAKNIEKLISKINVTSASQSDEKLNEILQAQEKSKTKSAGSAPEIWSLLTKFHAPRIAAAVVLLICISLFVLNLNNHPEKEETGLARASLKYDTPSELTTIASLRFAYRQGGMDMLEETFDKALRLVGQKPADISIDN